MDKCTASRNTKSPSRPGRIRGPQHSDHLPVAGPEISAEAGRAPPRGVRAADARAGRGGRGRLRRCVGRPAPGCRRSASCSRCGCRIRARRCTGCSPPRARRRSSKGHVHAFTVLGGVPTGKIRYDNLQGRGRRGCCSAGPGSSPTAGSRSAPTTASTPSTATPGIEGAHEKGGVEGEGGRFRRNHLVPMPEVDSLDELNAAARRLRRKPTSTGGSGTGPGRSGEHFAMETALLRAAARRARSRPGCVDPAGRPVRPDHRPAAPLLGAGAVDRPPGPGAAARLRPGASSTAAREVARHERLIAARLASRWTWTTTWRSCSASPARCPARPRWHRPAPRAGSPRPTTRAGPRPARPTATPTAPAR